MRPSIGRGLRRDLLVLLFFTALTLLLTWPLVARIGQMYAGNNEDLWVFQWDNWWTRVALQQGLDPLYTPYQFYPGGVSLAAHSLSFYNSLIWIPLAALFGDIAAYNITILLTFILSGYTMFKLAEYLLPDARPPLPALLAGVVFAFAPYHFSQSLGHVSLASVQWFPLLALFILKAARERAWRNVVAIGLLTLLIAATRLQFLILGGVVFALFVGVDWLASRREWSRGALARLIAGAAAGLILCLPLLVPAARLYMQAASPDELIADEGEWGQTDLLAYAVPMTYHPIFGAAVQPLYQRFVKNQAWMPFLGYTAVALATWGIARLRRRAWPWVAIGAFLFVMALGPTLRVNGVVYGDIRLPYALIGDRFPLNTLRSPDRYNLLMPLALAALAGAGADGVLRRWASRRGTIRVGLLGTLIVFEYLGLPYPTIEPLSTSPYFDALAADPEPYAILDIPLERSDTKRYLYYQTRHGKPIVEGRVARVPAEADALFDAIPLLAGWRSAIDPPYPPDLDNQLAQLAARDVRAVVVHKTLLAPEQFNALRDYFTRIPAYEDEQIVVYSTHPSREPGTPVGSGMGLFNGWATLSESPSAALRGQASVALEVHLRWAATGPLRGDFDYRLSLVGESGIHVAEHLCLRHRCRQTQHIDPPTSTWQPGALMAGDYQLSLPARLSPGVYRIRLDLCDSDHGVGMLELAHRILSLPEGPGPRQMVVTEEPRVRYGDAIELRAADVSVRGNWLLLRLYWHALEAPGVDTLYFVHVLDGDGNLVAQNDGIHVKYTRPSSMWQADEVIADPIEIPLWNLPTGEYRIAVGLTDTDGVHLTTIDASGRPRPDDRTILETRFTINRPTN
ncbi:MAG TPA: hypothetical protein VJ793_13570 [Anaerolineae bacterium]|nr:hypothetical protein [Anaerolineae bacterium]